MTDFHAHVRDYLRLRRALGFKLAFHGQVLPQFASYLEAAGATTLTVELALAWASVPAGVKPISRAHRLGVVRGFARYLQTIEPATELPPSGIWPTRNLRPTPYLWKDEDVVRLLEAARQLQPPLRALSLEALLGLLACSGIRIGEALALVRDDVDLAAGVLTIRQAKLDRVRLVPLHPSASEALRRYAEQRERLCPRPSSTSFFLSGAGRALGYDGVRDSFVTLTTALGLRTATVRPRIHDLRHSFSVRNLVDWQRAGAEVAPRMAALSNYLGHQSPAASYWYLSAAPELLELAAARLDARLAAVHR